MLQSPPAIFPDSSFRLQTLMHGRNYLSPVQSTSVPLQTPVLPLDPSLFRGYICQQGPPQRLPHFSLSVPPGEMLPQFQSHAGLSQTGYPPNGILSSGRPHLQPSSTFDSYSQTLFNLSQQAHISPPQPIPHPIGLPSVQGQVTSRQIPGKGVEHSSGRDADDVVRFPMHGMVGYMHEQRDGGFVEKNPSSSTSTAQDLSLKVPGAFHHHHHHHRLRLSQSSSRQSSPLHYSQTQPVMKSNQSKLPPRIHSLEETQRNITGNGKKDYLADDKDEFGAWKSYHAYSAASEMDFSFKDPNSVGVNHLRNGPAARHSSNSSATLPSLSPSVVFYENQSPELSASAGCQETQQQQQPGDRSPGAFHRHFSKGSVIQLASGQLKKVEELRTEDFLDSCGVMADLSVDTSRVIHVRLNHDNGLAVIGFAVGPKQIQVTVEAMVDHPFFVFNRGWSSCSPSKTLDRYGLPCLQLAVGDTCISLTHRYPNSPGPGPSQVSSNLMAADDEFLSSPKIQKSSKEWKGGSPGLSPEPQMVPVEAGNQKNEEVDSQVISPKSTLGQLSRQRSDRKRRWSAPDSGTNDKNSARSSVDSDLSDQSQIVLNSA